MVTKKQNTFKPRKSSFNTEEATCALGQSRHVSFKV